MKDQLTKYVELLFAGAPDAGDIQQEILQNTLDKYDDLIAQGKTPQAAYSLAISGIGDVNEILGNIGANPVYEEAPQVSVGENEKDAQKRRLMRAVAIAMYICCVIPVLVLGNIGEGVLAVSLMFLLIAAATALLIMAGSGSKEEEESEKPASQPVESEMRKAVKKAISTSALVLFLVVSFATGAWYITWLIFPISAAIQGLVTACMDLKEAGKHEN